MHSDWTMHCWSIGPTQVHIKGALPPPPPMNKFSCKLHGYIVYLGPSRKGGLFNVCTGLVVSFLFLFLLLRHLNNVETVSWSAVSQVVYVSGVLHNVLGVLRNVLDVLRNVPVVLRNVLGELWNVLSVFRNILGVLRNVLRVLRNNRGVLRNV